MVRRWSRDEPEFEEVTIDYRPHHAETLLVAGAHDNRAATFRLGAEAPYALKSPSAIHQRMSHALRRLSQSQDDSMIAIRGSCRTIALLSMSTSHYTSYRIRLTVLLTYWSLQLPQGRFARDLEGRRRGQTSYHILQYICEFSETFYATTASYAINGASTKHRVWQARQMA